MSETTTTTTRRKRFTAVPPAQADALASTPAADSAIADSAVLITSPDPSWDGTLIQGQPATAEVPETAPDPTLSGTVLTLPERARQAIGLVNKEAELKALAEKTVTITSITNADGREQVHSAMMVLKEERLAIQAAGKEARDEATRFSKEVIVQEKALVDLIKPEEQRLQNLRDDYDKVIADEKKAKAEADRKRKEALIARIQEIRDRVADCAGGTAEAIQDAIRNLTAIVIDETFAEFQASAENVHANVLARLRSMHTERLKFEVEQEQLRLQRVKEEADQAERKAKLDEEIARQRKERELTTSRFKEIQAIQNQVLIAATGRHPDRKAGTRQCIVDTLEETRAWRITEERFGELLPNAIGMRDATVKQIEESLERFDQRVRELQEYEQRQRDQRAADELRQAEQKRLDADRQQLEAQQAAARADQERLDAERKALEEEQAAALVKQAEFEKQLQADNEELAPAVAQAPTSKKPRYSFDPKSYELAEYFANGEEFTEEELHELAQAIQDVCETYCIVRRGE